MFLPEGGMFQVRTVSSVSSGTLSQKPAAPSPPEEDPLTDSEEGQ